MENNINEELKVGDVFWRYSDNAMLIVRDIYDNEMPDHSTQKFYDAIMLNGFGRCSILTHDVHMTNDYGKDTPKLPIVGQNLWKSNGDRYFVRCIDSTVPDTGVLFTVVSTDQVPPDEIQVWDADIYDIFTQIPYHLEYKKKEALACRLLHDVEKRNRKNEASSYDVWKKNLKIVHMPIFDPDYFKEGTAFCIESLKDNGCCKCNAILTEYKTRTLVFMHVIPGSGGKTETKIVDFKPYTDGWWSLKRLEVPKDE